MVEMSGNTMIYPVNHASGFSNCYQNRVWFKASIVYANPAIYVNLLTTIFWKYNLSHN